MGRRILRDGADRHLVLPSWSSQSSEHSGAHRSRGPQVAPHPGLERRRYLGTHGCLCGAAPVARRHRAGDSRAVHGSQRSLLGERCVFRNAPDRRRCGRRRPQPPRRSRTGSLQSQRSAPAGGLDRKLSTPKRAEGERSSPPRWAPRRIWRPPARVGCWSTPFTGGLAWRRRFQPAGPRWISSGTTTRAPTDFITTTAGRKSP